MMKQCTRWFSLVYWTRSPAPLETQDGGWDTIDELEEINLGVIEDPKPISDGALLLSEELISYETVVREQQGIWCLDFNLPVGYNLVILFGI